MSSEEFEFILDALEFIATYGQRFLPLYHFNWKTGSWSFRKKALKDTLTLALSLFKAMSTFSSTSDGSRLHTHAGDKDIDEIISRYTSYLATANKISSLLEKFPPHRRIPEDRCQPHHIQSVVLPSISNL